jgi:iron complex outermembrane receptor protein
MVYAGWSRGFRSGGFNDTITTTGLVDTFDPETLENNEVGFKTTWFDRRLLVNGSFFYNRYDDMQVKTRVVDLTTGSGSRVATLNIGDGTLSGLELEAMAVPTDGLVLNANVGLLHGKYRSFLYLDQDATEDALDLDPDAAPVFRDLSSNEWQHTPPWNYNLRVAYSFPLFDLGDLTLAANYYSQGEVHYNIRNFDGLKQSKYGIWGSQLSLLLSDEKTRITFWVKNLADRSYLTGGFHTDDLGFENRYYDGRRTYGLTVSRSFGGE